jgi:hypothetical protein
MMRRTEGMVAEPSDSARVVPVVESHGLPVIAAAIATVLALPAALLVFALAAFAWAEPAREAPERGFVLTALIAGWALCTWLLARRTGWPLVVLRRGLLLGTAQWLALAALVGVLPDGDRSLAQAHLGRAVGLPLPLPDASEATILALLCLMGALAATALRSALWPERVESER